jgi:hypothetical protein
MECEFAHQSEVLGAVLLRDARAIFAEGYVEHPVQLVLDVPVPAHQRLKALRRRVEARDVHSPFTRRHRSRDVTPRIVRSDSTSTNDELRPVGRTRQPRRLAKHPDTTHLQTTVPLVRRLVKSSRLFSKTCACRIVKRRKHFLVQSRLVPLWTKDVVCTLAHDLLRDVFLTPVVSEASRYAIEESTVRAVARPVRHSMRLTASDSAF